MAEEKKESFVSVTEDDLQRLVDGGTSEAAKKATAHWLRVVTAFRQEQGDKICFATCSAVQRLSVQILRWNAAEGRRRIPKKQLPLCASSYTTLPLSYPTII